MFAKNTFFNQVVYEGTASPFNLSIRHYTCRKGKGFMNRINQTEQQGALHAFPLVKAAERSINVNGVKINIKSIFTGQRAFDDALLNIVIRRMAEAEKLTA